MRKTINKIVKRFLTFLPIAVAVFGGGVPGDS